MAHVLFDQALLAEGGELDDPASFVKRVNRLIVEAWVHRQKSYWVKPWTIRHRRHSG